MKHKREYGLCVLVLCSIAVLTLVLGRRHFDDEPVFQGEPLSVWLERFNTNPAVAAHAIREMGPASVPFLVEMLSDEVRDVERRIWTWTRSRKIKTNLTIDRRWAALNGFHVLGAEARAGVPKLVELLANTNTHNAASAALASIGEDSAGALTRAATNGHVELRQGAVRALASKKYRVRDVSAALLHALRDADEGVRAAAAEAIGKRGQSPELAVPALVAALKDGSPRVRASAAIGLRHFRQSASSALAALQRAQHSETDEDARREAETAADWIEKAVPGKK